MGRYDRDNSVDASRAEVLYVHPATAPLPNLQEEIDGDGYINTTRPLGGDGAPMPTSGGRGASDE